MKRDKEKAVAYPQYVNYSKHSLHPITGYHPECHTPSIEPEADSNSWICRQCVFAVATKVRLLIFVSHAASWLRENIQFRLVIFF